MNLFGWESLGDISRNCFHHFVSKRDFERDAKRVRLAERFLKSPFGQDGGMKALLKTILEQCIITSLLRRPLNEHKYCVPYVVYGETTFSYL